MLTEEFIFTLKEASKRLKGANKRGFVAQVTNKYLEGSSRKAESKFGWNRNMVALGLKELESGIVCLPDYSKRCNQKTENIYPDLVKEIEEIIENDVQTDPKFQTNKKYCKITAKEVCEQLSQKEKYSSFTFKIRSMNNILNRLGYSLKKR